MTYSTTEANAYGRRISKVEDSTKHTLSKCQTGTVKATLDSHSEELELTFFYQPMFDSLDIQYLIQAPDYRPFSNTEGYISGCASGIPPVLELLRSVFVDQTIIRQILPSNSSTTKNIERGSPPNLVRHDARLAVERNIADVLNRSRFIVAVPLQES